VILLAFGLHFTISRLTDIGSFSYMMIIGAFLFLPPEEWEDAETVVPVRLRALADRVTAVLRSWIGPPREVTRTPEQERLADFGGWLRDLTACLVAVACFFQILKENPALPKRIQVDRRPWPFGEIVDNFHLYQYWHLFAPNAFYYDGTIIVDGELEDGTHVDPFTGQPPDFEQAFHGPLNYGQPWCDYFWRVGTGPYFAPYRQYFKEYLFRAHKVPGAKISKPLKKFDAYWVSYTVPPMGSTRPRTLKRTLIVSSDPNAVIPPPTLNPQAAPASIAEPIHVSVRDTVHEPAPHPTAPAPTSEDPVAPAP
jgi:hypothetical protein